MTEDSLIVITPIQLKQTNLIFVEHSMLKLEVEILGRKVDIQEKLNENLSQSLVVKDQKIWNLESTNSLRQVLIDDQNKEIKKLKREKKWLIFGGCTIGVASFVLGLTL